MLALALVLSFGLVLSGCNGDSDSQVSDDAAAADPAPVETPGPGESFSIPSGRAGVPAIRVTVIEKGDGMQARVGDTVALHYTGTFLDGKQFDSSAGGAPFEFRIGHGGAIDGWQIVAERMRIGDRWKAVIPSGLAYGQRGHPAGIPGDTDLAFDMELVRIR